VAKDILMFEFVHPKIVFCQHLCRSKPYDFLSSVEHKRYFEESCSLNRFNYYLLPLYRQKYMLCSIEESMLPNSILFESK